MSPELTAAVSGAVVGGIEKRGCALQFSSERRRSDRCVSYTVMCHSQWDTLWEICPLVTLSLCQHHRVHLHQPRWSSLLYTWAAWYSLLLLGCTPAWHVAVLSAVGNWNTVVSVCIPKHGTGTVKYSIEDKIWYSCQGHLP